MITGTVRGACGIEAGDCGSAELKIQQLEKNAAGEPQLKPLVVSDEV